MKQSDSEKTAIFSFLDRGSLGKEFLMISWQMAGLWDDRFSPKFWLWFWVVQLQTPCFYPLWISVNPCAAFVAEAYVLKTSSLVINTHQGHWMCVEATRLTALSQHFKHFLFSRYNHFIFKTFTGNSRQVYQFSKKAKNPISIQVCLPITWHLLHKLGSLTLYLRTSNNKKFVHWIQSVKTVLIMWSPAVSLS